jgi:hypothetical protein
MLTQVVSGGQTGVDRAGLDAAISIGIPHGGWCPEGRRAEDGSIPDKYQLKETPGKNYAIRTRLNVKDSDGTLILFEDTMSRGTELTAKNAQRLGRPLCTVDIIGFLEWETARFEEEIRIVCDWIEENEIEVLNIAGPRESSSSGIGAMATAFLKRLFEIQVAA